MTEKLIVAEGLSKRYGSFWAVQELSFHVNAGEIFGFLGVNGAGKTTTLRMLTGILKPTAGRITIAGFNMDENPVEAKAVTGYIPDRPYLYPKLTGREFLYFVADLYLVPAKEADQRIDTLLEEYSLTNWQDELVESYSHGMKQRLATCAAVLHQPKVLIIDEPMVGLDPHGARLLKQSLKKYAQSGMAIMLSTHSLNVAEELSDRLAIIDKGKLISVGTFAEIKASVHGFEGGLESLFIELTSNREDLMAPLSGGGR